MAITHTTASRNALCSEVNTLCNAGTTNPNAQLIVMTAGDATLATLEMSNPAFLAPSGGSMSADTITADTNATAGTAALFKVVDRDGTEVFRGSVGTSGADLNLSSVDVANGDTVSVTSLTYEASA